MEGSRESDETVESSGRLTFECGCGERLIILGLKEDWLSEQRTNFECGCGQIKNRTLRPHESVYPCR
jgi:hypothetical protein